MEHIAALRFGIAFAVALGCTACGGSSSDTSGGPPDVPAGEAPPRIFRTFQAAAGVLGQPDFTSRDANRGLAAPTAATLSTPRGAAAGGGLLVIADTENQRVLAFRTSSGYRLGPEADFQLGLAGHFVEPWAVSVGLGKIVVADRMAHRVLIYDAASPEARPVVVGQPGLESSSQVCDASHLWLPRAVQITPDGKLIVADSGFSRILIWESLPVADGQPAQVVLGQPHFRTCVANREGGDPSTPTQDSMRDPQGVWSDGVRLAVSDSGNRRVLLWDAITMQSDQPPDRVLGQPDFGSSQLWPAAADTLRGPTGVASDGARFAVADTFNNRVLIWNGWPSRDTQAAEVVLGQRAFDLREPNDGSAASGQTLVVPTGLVFDAHQLVVTDPGNSRVLVFKPE